MIWSGSTNQHTTNTSTAIRDLSVNGNTYILHFDISDIPTTATVSSATLTVNVQDQNCTAETIQAVKIEDPDSSGVFSDDETEQDGFNNDATWNFKNDTDNTDWSVGESNNFGDVDDNSPEGSGAASACPSFEDVSLTITNMVQDWVTTPASNAGMYLDLTNTGKLLVRNKRYTTAGDRPELSVTFTDASRRVIMPSD